MVRLKAPFVVFEIPLVGKIKRCFFKEGKMTKRMLIDDTQPEETRVVIVDGNKVEDVEFESTFRRQIKGNIYTAKVIRVEPSLQAAFVDYGGNRHGFLAFGEIHPDYYNVRPEVLEAVERETDEIIERKKQYIKEREEQRERWRAEKQAQYKARLKEEAAASENAQQEELQAPQEAEQVVETPETDSQEKPVKKGRYTRRATSQKSQRKGRA